MDTYRSRSRYLPPSITAGSADGVGARLILRGSVRGHPHRVELELRIAPPGMRERYPRKRKYRKTNSDASRLAVTICFYGQRQPLQDAS
jgi:hypothetical protein